MSEEPLKPARVEHDGKRTAYGPRIPWKWLIAGVLVLGVMIGGYSWRESTRAEELRNQIIHAYDVQLGPAVDRTRRFRERVEGWVMESAQEAPETWVDPRLKLAGLHSAQGLYLRLHIRDAESPETIARGAAQMEPDSITRCMGITPISMRGLYDRGAFLMPGWIDRAHEAEGVMKLRVVDDELARHVERDLPIILNMMRAQYFLLAIQHSDNRRDGPVDFFMWDLRENQPLLRTRTQAQGLLIPVRIAMKGAPTGPAARPRLDSGGANDCSIAAQIKALTGEPALTFGSELPDPAEQEPEGGEAPEGGEGAAEDEGAEGTPGEATGPAEPAEGGESADQGSAPTAPDPPAVREPASP